MNIEDLRDIFEPYEKLVDISILGEIRQVPENNTLLRGFQYLNVREISMGDFCWNGDCANCRVKIAASDGEKTALACRTKAEAGMIITELDPEISSNLNESE